MRIPLHAADTPVTGWPDPLRGHRTNRPRESGYLVRDHNWDANRLRLTGGDRGPFGAAVRQPAGRMREEIGGAQPVGDLRARHRSDEPQGNLERGGESGQARPFRSVAENDHLRASRGGGPRAGARAGVQQSRVPFDRDQPPDRQDRRRR